MLLEPCPFDSEIFGLRVGRLVLDEDPDVRAALAESRRQFDLTLLRVNETKRALQEALSAHQLAPLETLVTCRWSGGDYRATAPDSIVIGHHASVVVASDVEAISMLTARSIGISHFHSDARLPRHLTDRLYANWARNDVAGRASRTIVARFGDEIVGYLAALQRDGLAIIDLVAVDDSWRGRGIGAALVSNFLEWVREVGLAGEVGTQSDNRALALYMRAGFVPTLRQRTYHLWSKP